MFWKCLLIKNTIHRELLIIIATMAMIRAGLQRLTSVFSGQGGILSRLASQNPNPIVAQETKEVIATCNKLVEDRVSRNFAIVHLLGKQWRVTDGDLLVVEGHWPPNIGDQIKLDKVLLAATKDFSLIGRPLVQPGLVNVTATIISKGLSHTKTHFKKKRRKQFMRINFQRLPQTMLRINTVEITNRINEAPQNVF